MKMAMNNRATSNSTSTATTTINIQINIFNLHRYYTRTKRCLSIDSNDSTQRTTNKLTNKTNKRTNELSNGTAGKKYKYKYLLPPFAFPYYLIL
mmetsp:Transcript_18178/g.22895  ORF Transcript_18178/g.22895 Transcript_18178/m.22895 type:complete len:94 (+) Transcript_18178:705-986(+)